MATNTFSNLTIIATNQGVEPSADYAPAAPAGVSGQVDVSACQPGLPSDFLGAPGPEQLCHIPDGSCSGPCYPAWPVFTPDGNGIIYALISEPDFAIRIMGRDVPSKSELWYADLTTGETVRLSNANRALADESAELNYYPTVLPEQVGGYYWLIWTSTRKWGTRSTEAPAGVELHEELFGPAAREMYKKRLWVSAIKRRLEPDGTFSTAPLEDPSSPPFYLPGQGATGNTRPVAALKRCRAAGESCTTELDCCVGACEVPEGASEGSCTGPLPCAHLNERCGAGRDCCPAAEGFPRQPMHRRLLRIRAAVRRRLSITRSFVASAVLRLRQRARPALHSPR